MTTRVPNCGRGFSLIEVMVASAVLSVVLAILLGTMTSSIALWRNTENKISADREGRAAGLLLASDLASAVMTTNPNLWPKVANDCLRFLTAKPSDYQDTNSGDLGDICYVEYFLSPDKSALLRNYYGSAWTYQNVLLPGQFRSAPEEADAQVLATNLLARPADSVRGTRLEGDANNTPFVVLGTNSTSAGNPGDVLPLVGSYNANNPPVAVEVNLSVADADSIANKDLLENRDYKLRNAGFFSFRVSLPSPPK
jgi:prepilin-type N-terminal cleavage/methylation domain-containing protein